MDKGLIAQPQALTGLVDPQGRRFAYLRLSLTDACNYRCSYCLPDGYQATAPRDYLSGDEIAHLVAGLAELGIWKIRLTGGEPTVRRDFLDIAARVRAQPGIRRLAVTTNGHALAGRTAAWRAAGIDALNISVDSLNRENFRAITGKDHLPRVLNGIDEALAAGFASVKLNCVLLRGKNDHEIDAFLDYVRQRPLTVRFIELMETGDNAAFFARHQLSGSVVETHLRQLGWSAVARREGDGPAREFAHPDYLGRIGLITPYARDFCSSCNRLRVTARGLLRLCLFGEGGHSLRPLLQSAEQQPELLGSIRQLLAGKAPSHLLHFHNSGDLGNLSALGG